MQTLSLLERRQYKTKEIKYLYQSDRGVSEPGLPGLLAPKPCFSTTLLYSLWAWAKPGEYGNKTHPVPALVELSFWQMRQILNELIIY